MPNRNEPGQDPAIDRLLDLAAQSWAEGWVETNSGPPIRLPRAAGRKASPAPGTRPDTSPAEDET